MRVAGVCTERAFRVAGVGNGGSGASPGIVLRGRRREPRIAGFHRPVQQIGCVCARRRACRDEIVAGAGRVLICGCILAAGVSQYAMGV